MRNLLLICLLAMWAGGQAAQAAINIPSDGSDGPLIITSNTVIDLSQAITGNWNDPVNGVNVGKGIYDASKWAVVFKYSSVSIQGGAIVTFINHPSHAPVVWLVSNDVQIDGIVSLNGQDSVPTPGLAEPGPGGFRGGMGHFAFGAFTAAGFGPGGGRGRDYYYRGEGGRYGTIGGFDPASGTSSAPPYGNPSLIPLIGGSGGGGSADNSPSYVNYSGSGGGGAILIACALTFTLNGGILCNGGGASVSATPGGGSGGGIRVVAESLLGAGRLEALGGRSNQGKCDGGLGRIRIESVNTNSSLTYIVPDPSVLRLPSAATPPIWMPDGGPAVIIESINGLPAPADPRASFGAVGPDIVLPQLTNTTVKILTTNVEPASVVSVRATPRADASYTEANAVVETILNADPQVIRWTALLPVKNGYAAMQVHVKRP